MPRRTARPRSLSKILLSAILIPTPSLSLILNQPIPYGLPSVLLFSWTEEPGDPTFISIRLRGCAEELLGPVNTQWPHGLTENMIELLSTHTMYCIQEVFNSNTSQSVVWASFTIKNTGGTLQILNQPITGFSLSNSSTTNELPVVPHSNYRGALIGGVLGGLAFLAFSLGLSFLYCRRRRARRASMLASHPNEDHRRKPEAGSGVMPLPMSFSFDHYMQKHTVKPLPQNENYRPPGSNLERLERARQEMEEVQGLRDAFQLDLERRSNLNGPHDGLNGGLESADNAALRIQVEQMSTIIVELQAEVQRQVEENLPPDYSATMGS